jgi:competence protein ComFC
MRPASRLLARAVYWIAPRFCLLCGLPVDPAEGPDIPLCPTCAASLKPMEGERCSRCGRPLISETGTCFSCRGRDGACSEIFPVFAYRGGIASLIREYKEGRRASLAAFWTDWMEGELRSRWPDRTVVPVPPRPEKIKARLWDQVEAIASCLEARGIPVARPLARTSSSQQKRLSRQARSENALASYSLSPSANLPLPGRIVLIDDVYTTGATVEACSKALLGGGAISVVALVLAAD